MGEREDLRLECLKLALARAGANDPRPWRAIAEELHGWVTGAPPPSSAPPVPDRARDNAAVPRRR